MENSEVSEAETAENDDAVAVASIGVATCDDNSSVLAQRLRALISENQIRTQQLDQRQKDLEVIEMRTQNKLAELKQENSRLQSSLEQLTRASSQEIQSLVKMYESMKPAQAGPIFDAMAPEFAAGFLTQMNSENAAQIMASMDTQKAYAISITIAGNAANRRAKVQ